MSPTPISSYLRCIHKIISYIPMLRSTQAFLKQAAKLSRPSMAPMASCAASSSSSSVPVVVRRASSTTSASPFDYDQIMRTSVSNFSSVAGDNRDSPSPSVSSMPFFSLSSMSDGLCAATNVQVPSGIGVAQPATKSNCYRSVDEPTGSEDYDVYELHHSPCQRTEYDPHSGSGGEVGSII